MTTAAIIVAAGMGQRFGSAGKSFVELGGRPMAWWPLLAASASRSISELVLVCSSHSYGAATELLQEFPSEIPVTLVLGGARRQDSSLAGICATSEAVDLVAIHDAARPLVTSELFDSVVAAGIEFGAAIAAVPVSDTIKRVADSQVSETIPRDNLVSVQTPQAFRKQLLLDAFAFADRSGMNVTDEASLIEQSGGIVHVVPGSAMNLKVTFPGDLAIIEALMARESR